MTTANLPIIGIGACLDGQAVRYDGSSKSLNPQLAARLQAFTKLSYCPEAAIGLGIPRPPIHLVDHDGHKKIKDVATGINDVTDELTRYAQSVSAITPSLNGYVGVYKSPSCGTHRVKRHSLQGQVIARDSQGQFVYTLAKLNPLLPIADDVWLSDQCRLDSFITRVYLCSDTQQLPAAPSAAQVQKLYSTYKYLLMAHHPATYKTLGKKIANYKKNAELFTGILSQMHLALNSTATRKHHANTLSHIAGYYRRFVDSKKRKELSDMISNYRNGTLARTYILQQLALWQAQHPNSYLASQRYLNIQTKLSD